MDERIKAFLKNLEESLKGLNRDEVRKAISYYHEYFEEAMQEGNDPGEVISNLEPIHVIAKEIKAENSIARAGRNPGLKNLGSILKNISHIVGTPFSAIILSVFVMLCYLTAAVYFITSTGLFITAGAVTVFLLYEAFTIPAQFTMEIAGTAGVALHTGSIIALAALFLYMLAKLFIRFSVWTVRKTAGKMRPAKHSINSKRIWLKRPVIILSAIAFSGLLLFSVSGIPNRFLTIFNSMKPENVNLRSHEFDVRHIDEISVTTAHSHITLKYNNSDRVLITYEQPDWLHYSTGKDSDSIYFIEQSNGRLPLFELVSIHESVTDVTVSIPRNNSLKKVSVQSRGGFLHIVELAESIEAQTLTGSIFYYSKTSESLKEQLNISATTATGHIEFHGTLMGKELEKNTGSANSMFLQSKRGDIIIR